MADSLPDDVVMDILSRIKDVPSLLRCAAVCKGWRRLVARMERVGVFAGFFTQLQARGQHTTPWFIPSPRPVPVALGRRRRRLSSLVPDIRVAGFFDYAVPLVSHHGLLLLRINTNLRGGILAVCDLLAGTLRVLPSLLGYNLDEEMMGYTLLTNKDRGSLDDDQHQRPFFFKVVIVTILKNHGYYTEYSLQTFSSANETGWSRCSGDLLKAGNHNIRVAFMQREAVVCGSAAHWLFFGLPAAIYTLDLSNETGHVSITELKGIDNLWVLGVLCVLGLRDKPYLTVDTEAKLMLLCLQQDGHQVQIWTSRDNKMFFQSSILKLKQRVCKCLGEKSGIVLFMDKQRVVYLADVKTGVMQEVTQWPYNIGLCRQNTVLVEMDWPAFFAFRLGVAGT
ncbi:hypothetical protein CFC21_050785 [Triticum aestivum]|uniref:F-box domain-containing protein n=2 Tax=Triticum aestivum TaxID=4565 RepID=A0A3B6H4K2_WHEAT|nr:hypothetical protein CFC21_050785 [Triticum aestivum]